ncbi:MAG TPA: GMC family oxidoreductase [Actinobacteria bacterium]|nr:GMC family oxidoreductase [Actinomycetota bacterium]
MITDGRELAHDVTVDADVCIVGAGPAGISLALELARRSRRTIALVETGGMEFSPAEQELADGRVEGLDYFPVKETRIRMFGGSTASWGGIISPLDPLDFERRPWVPHSGWPFPHSELDPYLDRAFELFQIQDQRSTVEELPEAERHHQPTPDTRWEPIYFSAPARFGKLYADAVARSAQIHAYLHSTVTSIELDPSGGRVDHLRVATLAGNTYRIRAADYVLAGGGIENARLLLVSRSVHANGVGNRHDLVGRFFQEHPRAKVRYLLPDDIDGLPARITGAAGTLRFSRISLAEATYRREELLAFMANLTFGYLAQDTPQFEALRRIVNASRAPWSDSPYYQDVGGGPNRLRWRDLWTVLKRPDRTLVSALGAALQPARLRRWIQIDASVEQVPDPANRITLLDEKDPLGLPLPKIIWSVSDAEERTYRRGLELTLEALETYAPGLSARRVPGPDPWPEAIQGTWHHIGTTRMHVDPRHGVVDADARVHGVGNLYVAGSSVFPTGGVAAPTLTIVLLALRLAEHLAARPRPARIDLSEGRGTMDAQGSDEHLETRGSSG